MSYTPQNRDKVANTVPVRDNNGKIIADLTGISDNSTMWNGYLIVVSRDAPPANNPSNVIWHQTLY